MRKNKKRQGLKNCRDCKLLTKTIFNNLTKAESDKLFTEKTCAFFKKGTIIYHEGNRTNGVYCVNNGIIKMYKTGFDGKEQIIRFAQAGDIIGYRSILSDEVACTTAKTIEESNLCFIPEMALLKLVKTNSSFSLGLMKLSCKELGESNKFLLDIAQKTVRERLAEILLLLKDTFGIESNGNLKVVLSREEIANIAGTATESIIRVLSEFKNDGIIDIDGRKIRLLRIDLLINISNVF